MERDRSTGCAVAEHRGTSRSATTRTWKSASATLSVGSVLVLVVAALGCASPAPAPSPSATAAASAAQSRFATLDGNRIHYESIGSGREALVLIHGWSADTSVWRLQVPELAKRTRVIAVDLPGHGQSDKPQSGYTMDLFARAIEAVMRDAGVHRAVLAGHSMGTPVIRQFYRIYPEKTLALVAVDGALQNLYSGALDPLIQQLRGPGYKEFAEKFIASMFPNAGTEALRDATLATVRATPQHVMVGTFESMRDPAIWKDDPITVPLFVVNAKSPYWTPAYEEYVRKLAPQVEFSVIEGPGHFLMLEKPQEFNVAVLDFLDSRNLLRG